MLTRRLLPLVLLVSAAVCMTGCGGPFAPAGIYARTPVELEQEPTVEVARAYGQQREAWFSESAKFEAELRRRAAFTDEEWARIKSRDIRLGDTQALVFAAWGEPVDGVTRESIYGNSAVWYYDHDTTRPEARGHVTFHGNSVASIDR